jgi:hypothetical protein
MLANSFENFSEDPTMKTFQGFLTGRKREDSVPSMTGKGSIWNVLYQALFMPFQYAEFCNQMSIMRIGIT